jgi:hypothetical protein
VPISEDTSNPRIAKLTARTAGSPEEQTGKRQVVVVAREVMGRARPFIVSRESEAVPLIRKHVASGTIIHAEWNAWERLHASYDVRRVNHSVEYKAEDGANVNQAESYFSRLQRAEIGQHHQISGKLLYQYANEAASREDNRRKPNGTNWNTVIGSALTSRKSPIWTGYWHRSAA